MGNRSEGVAPITNQKLAWYTGALVVGVLVVQGYTAFVADGRVTAAPACCSQQWRSTWWCSP
jgi:hypothetical protein